MPTARHCSVDLSSLLCFIDRITTKTASTLHDEYWHPHVDKTTYGSFHYTGWLHRFYGLNTENTTDNWRVQ